MATTALDGKYLLVSDSNEVSSQLDSKKLGKEDLVEIAQENLFNKYLKIMSDYLSVSQFKTYENTFKDKLGIQQDRFDYMVNLDRSNKFGVVDGQVILIDREQLDKYNKYRVENDELAYSPYEYLITHWYITSDFTVVQLENCMLRGMTYIDMTRQDEIKKQSNANVPLHENNIPPHMHHSGVTSGANIECMYSLPPRDSNVKTRFMNNGTAYDMFYNDSFSTGMAKNELEGTVDGFSVQSKGEDVSDGQSPAIMHNNIPAYKEYYVFVVRKNST